MATIQEKLADSLAELKAYQDTHEDNLVIKGIGIWSSGSSSGDAGIRRATCSCCQTDNNQDVHSS